MNDEPKNIEELLEQEPGNPVFVEYAEELRQKGEYGAALEVCLRGLSHNPGCHHGRLVLARIFFEQRYLPFAIRELELLRSELPQNRRLKGLLERLSGASCSAVEGVDGEVVREEATLAEADFAIEDLESIEEDQE